MWIAEFDSCYGNRDLMPIADVDCHRSGRRTLVAGWERYRFYVSRVYPECDSQADASSAAIARKSRRPRNRKSRRSSLTTCSIVTGMLTATDAALTSSWYPPCCPTLA